MFSDWTLSEWDYLKQHQIRSVPCTKQQIVVGAVADLRPRCDINTIPWDPVMLDQRQINRTNQIYHGIPWIPIALLSQMQIIKTRTLPTSDLVIGVDDFLVDGLEVGQR